MLENMIDYVRIALYTLLVLFVFLLYQAWQKDHPVLSQPQVAQSQVQALPDGRYIPQSVSAPGAATQTAAQPAVQSVTTPDLPATSTGQVVNVTTDTMQVMIDTHGGDVIGVKLLKYPETQGSTTPFVLLNNDPNTRYIAESGLLGDNGPDSSQQAAYTTTQTDYRLSPDQQSLQVTLNWQNQQGLHVSKVFSFARDSYEINVSYHVRNDGTTPWEGKLYSQLSRTDNPPVNSGGIVNLTTFFGAAISTPDKPFDKLTFKSIAQNPLDKSVKGGWAAMIQHYFISAWVPPSDANLAYYSRALPNGLYTVGMVNEPFTVAPGATVSKELKLYTGPSSASRLEKVSPTLKLAIDYGWFWFIAVAIFWMMQKIYDVIGNWGWAIVFVTIIIKLLFYQLSAKSYRSMRDLKRLQPKIESLKERYKDDKQKLTQATLELYKAEKVNPMGGCLPILIQIPVFFALYWVIVESVELRQAPFILWIHDLSQHDPYYILPLLMGASMFVQQLLNPPAPDPMQQKVMMLMPVIFTVLFANFPAGLMLYWFVNNTLSFLQQWYIMHSFEKRGTKKEVK